MTTQDERIRRFFDAKDGDRPRMVSGFVAKPYPERYSLIRRDYAILGFRRPTGSSKIELYEQEKLTHKLYLTCDMDEFQRKMNTLDGIMSMSQIMTGSRQSNIKEMARMNLEDLKHLIHLKQDQETGTVTEVDAETTEPLDEQAFGEPEEEAIDPIIAEELSKALDGIESESFAFKQFALGPRSEFWNNFRNCPDYSALSIKLGVSPSVIQGYHVKFYKAQQAEKSVTPVKSGQNIIQPQPTKPAPVDKTTHTLPEPVKTNEAIKAEVFARLSQPTASATAQATAPATKPESAKVETTEPATKPAMKGADALDKFDQAWKAMKPTFESLTTYVIELEDYVKELEADNKNLVDQLASVKKDTVPANQVAELIKENTDLKNKMAVIEAYNNLFKRA